MPRPILDEKFELTGGSYSLSGTQDCFEFFIKKNEITKTDYEKAIVNPPIIIYINKIENTITFKFKSGYYLELLPLGTMKYFEFLKKIMVKMNMIKMYLD